MKYILFIASFLTFQTTFAWTDHPNTTPPAGFTISADGWYYKDGNTTDRYRPPSSSTSSAGSAAGGANTSRSGDGPNTSDSTNIFNNQITNKQLRDGDVNMDTIPLAIAGIIQFVLGIAGTLAIASLIYHAVQMQINSGITGDSSGVDKAKKGMYASLIGFVITILAWFIVLRVVQILTNIT